VQVVDGHDRSHEASTLSDHEGSDDFELAVKSKVVEETSLKSDSSAVNYLH